MLAEARDAFRMIAAEVLDVHGDVSFMVADRLKLGDLYCKLKTDVEEQRKSTPGSRN